MASTKLSIVRGELIADLNALIHKNAVLNVETDTLELPVYKGSDGCEIFSAEINSETVLFLSISQQPSKNPSDGKWNHEQRISVTTNENEYYIDELYADDIEKIVEHVSGLTDNDLFECRRHWDLMQSDDYLPES